MQKCDQQYSLKSLAKHQRDVHEGIKYPCGKCGQKFSQKGSFTKHQMIVREGVTYHCEQCTKHFPQKESLRNHQREIHDEMKYDCIQCGKQCYPNAQVVNRAVKGRN